MVTTVTNILAVLAVIAQAVSLLILAMLGRRAIWPERWKQAAMYFSWIVALVATAGSLFFSEIAHFTPCTLCWYQRILMYPLAFILAVALIRKDRGIAPYVFVLTIPGILLSSYHYLLQIGVMPELPCSAVGFSISCSERFFTTFGYITIPLMSWTAFVFITILTLVWRKSSSPRVESAAVRRPNV